VGARQRRDDGPGCHLLALAEHEAQRHGCPQVVLATHGFRAPDFYAKHRYKVVGVVEGYPAPHQHIYLWKALD